MINGLGQFVPMTPNWVPYGQLMSDAIYAEAARIEAEEAKRREEEGSGLGFVEAAPASGTNPIWGDLVRGSLQITRDVLAPPNYVSVGPGGTRTEVRGGVASPNLFPAAPVGMPVVPGMAPVTDPGLAARADRQGVGLNISTNTLLIGGLVLVLVMTMGGRR